MAPAVATERLTAEERREQIIRETIPVFAERGYAGASTEEIARRVGISQPYLFRLFTTKRDLVLAAIRRCFEDTEAVFTRAAGDLTGEAALQAIGDAYVEMIRSDPVKLRAQLQAYAACDNDRVRALVADGFGGLVALVRRLSGIDAAAASQFFAEGMLLNVLAVMGQFDRPAPWAAELIDACITRGELPR